MTSSPCCAPSRRTTAACLGFGTAVINLYRPAWDDFHTVVVEGSDEARRAAARPDLDGGRLGAAARRALRAPRRVLDPRTATSTGARTGSRPTCRRSSRRGPGRAGIPRTRCSCRCARARARSSASCRSTSRLDGRRPDDEQLDLLVGMSPARRARDRARPAGGGRRAPARGGRPPAAVSPPPRRAPHDRRDARRRLRRHPRRARVREGRRVARGATAGMLHLRAAVGMSEDGARAAGTRARRPRSRRCSTRRWSATACVLLERARRPRARRPVAARRARSAAATAAARGAWDNHCAARPAARPRGRASRASSGSTTRSTGCCRPPRCCRRCGRSPTRR